MERELIAYAPNGSAIIGTSERVLCTATGSFVVDDVGMAFAYDDNEAKMYWGTQETLKNDAGRLLFAAEDGNEYTVDDLVFKYADGTIYREAGAVVVDPAFV